MLESSIRRVATVVPIFIFAMMSLCAFATVGNQLTTADAKTKTQKKNAKKKANSPRKGPSGLKFYKAPAKTPKQHGRLIWQRNAAAPVKLTAARYTKLVLYTSRSPQGKRIAVSGTISIPKGKKPAGGWPIISYGHGTTGIADKCAPSRDRINGPASDLVRYTDPQLNAWLRAGYAVARTDYEGLGTPGTHPFLIGKSEGRGMLDILRAASDLDRTISKRYLLAGHSQGGQAALFAAGEASKWVPEFKLRGIVSYSPASQLRLQASSLPLLTTPSGISALAGLIVRGATTQTDAIDPVQLMSNEAFSLYPQTVTECLPRLTEADSFGGLAPSTLVRPGADMEPLLDLVDKQNPAVATSVPILLAQGDADQTTFKFLTDALNGELVELGNQVDYRVFAGVNHGDILEAAEEDVMDFFETRLPVKR